MTRAVIYARYSSHMQREASIEDQVRLSAERAEREGWQVLETFADMALSGASMQRPGLQSLLDRVQRGDVDIVLAEALDRLSRDQADVASLYKRLRFHGARLFTLSEGEVSELHVGLKGTMNQLFLKDLADKTRRGLRGRVEEGHSGGGNSYGYDVVRRLGSDGLPVTGERVINESEAAIIREVFTAFADGHSPKAIAQSLNKRGIPGPRGLLWRDTAIRGHRTRGTGLLNNELYVGRLVWNRLRYIKDPETGRRVSRLNTQDAWIVTDVPELRIVDQTLWDRVKARQDGIASSGRVTAIKATRFWEKRRQTHLLTGLLRCGCCGGGFASVGKDYLACSAARKLGTCTQKRSFRREELEEAVLDLLRHRLMQPEAVAAFVRAYSAEINASAQTADQDRARLEAELRSVTAKLDGLINAIAEGLRSPGLQDKLLELEAHKAELSAKIAEPAPAPVSLHPNLAELYRRKVTELAQALKDPAIRTPAVESVRSLIDCVTVTVGTDCVKLDLQGAIVAMIDTAQPGAARDLDACSVKVVAGVGFEPTTFRL